ncbi:MAG: TetR/AcrR family transcriptional regulator [Nocardioidaceae bacterium]|nr:TetR/AcrR family transcriptional regulator [Nocardioidaceae bacterium]
MARSKDLARREALLDEAASVLARKGMLDTSLRALAEEMGTTARMLIYYFGSKDQMILAVLDRERHSETQHAPARSLVELRDVILADWDDMVDGSRARGVRILVQVYGSACAPESDFSEYTNLTMSSLISNLEETLTRLEIPSEEAKVRAEILVGAIQGFIIRLCTTEDSAVLRRSYASLADFVTRPPGSVCQ